MFVYIRDRVFPLNIKLPMVATHNNALIVEGGGMRGTFSIGVLDAFLRQKFNPFDLFVGVSSGSTNMASYLANQEGRSLETYINHSCQKRFISYSRFFKGGDLMDLPWLWEVVERDLPLDQHTLFATPRDFFMVLTHATTGEPLYLKAAPDNIITGLMASSAIPIVNRQPIMLHGEPYFDGGISDALPVRWVAEQGAKNVLLVRTRPYDYKKRISKNDVYATWFYKRKAPLLAEKLSDRVERYNRAVTFMRNDPPYNILEINPPKDKKLAGVVTTNKQRLMYTYQTGIEAGLAAMEAWRNTCKG